MKTVRYFAAIVCLVLVSASAYAQKSTLPKNILNTLEKKCPGAEDVQWKVKSKGDYEIKFKLNGKKTEVEIDEDGTWEKTTTHISVDELPKAVRATVMEQKKDAEISELKVIVTNDDETYYRVNLKDGNGRTKLKIDKKGKITSSEVKKKEK